MAGIDYTNNIMNSGLQGSRVQVASNQWGTLWWGLTLKTPLTDGWNGVAHLEIGFGTNDGQSNNNSSLFNRRSNVGVSNEQYGELTVGRQLMQLSVSKSSDRNHSSNSIFLGFIAANCSSSDRAAVHRNWVAT
ncbi:porin [Duganella levis]|uniref:Porin n=1 Tax=Duganella levis TaxID=2692169 RepID=A0ABW9VT89_9BURK|nr:porin [Duganella levis]